MSHDCTRAIIDLDAVSSNFDAVCRKAKVPVMAVISIRPRPMPIC